jgi:glycosyltransferase involved in cell wall biosynthesis
VEILVVTNSCSQKKYEEIRKKRIRQVIDPQQKFFRLMISGLSEANNGNVTALSALPVSASTIVQKTFTYEEETDETGVKYRYLPFRNGKFTRYLSLLLATRKYIKDWCKEKIQKETMIIVDPLVPVIAIPARKVAQKYGINVCAVVTDIPTLSTNMKERRESSIKKWLLSMYQKISDADLKSYDAYIPLTESINEVVNENGKPYVVVEGFADSKDTEISKNHEDYIMYAGGVYEKYGVKALIEAFISLNRKDIQLYIFGDGSYVEELKNAQDKYPNIKYMGCVLPKEVVAYEKRALLLVNPRPTGEEFAKYSFPSKTMEYLLSGAPVLSTRLPGIPTEYFDYLYAIEGCTADDIKAAIEQVLALDKQELYDRGVSGRNFVLKNKNNVKMSDKIIELMKTL